MKQGGTAALCGAVDYSRQLAIFIGLSLAKLVRTPSHSHRAIAARRLTRSWITLFAGFGIATIILMLAFDVPTISIMPPRGATSLWLVRVVTDFGKTSYVIWSLGTLLLIVVGIAPSLDGGGRASLALLEIRIAFIFLAVAVPNLVGECLKVIIGRGRPFVGGAANAFNYSPLAWSEQFASLPSGHAITSFALAFAVSAVWPKTKYVMAVYGLLIGLSRIVLLAHHPSDVAMGAFFGLIGAMVVRHWFAARRLGFVSRSDGSIVSLPGPSFARIKRVAARALAQ